MNVYALGATFIRLVATLKLHWQELPMAEPTLYIVRFANKLDFEDKTADVIKDTTRLVSRMDRDWIINGRRPAGICAACKNFHPFFLTELFLFCFLYLKKRPVYCCKDEWI
jgi:transcription factor IIIB 90 kDa subunit